MPRLTADQWADIRQKWEGEPTATFQGLGERFGIDKANISRRAKKEAWTKRGQIASINEAAGRRADAVVDADGNATTTQPQRNAGDLATRDESEAKRAAVLVRHRQEWAELESFRKTALKAMKDAHDGSKEWREAKVAADTALANMRALEVKQHGEAKAWMLDFRNEEDIVIRNPRAAA